MDRRKRYTITLDDDPIVHKIIAKITGMNSLPFSNPEKLVERAKSYDPVAIFIDIHLGVETLGLDIIPRLREAWSQIPLLVVTADPAAKWVGQALAVGANDFVRKPLIPEEFRGRLQARISEMNILAGKDEIQIFDVVYDRRFRTLHRDDRMTHLPNLEAKLFETLAENNGMAIPKEVLKGNLWGKVSISENALDKKVSSLRSHLRDLGANFELKSAYRGGVSFVESNKGRGNDI